MTKHIDENDEGKQEFQIEPHILCVASKHKVCKITFVSTDLKFLLVESWVLDTRR